jgi:peptide deformylase
MGLVKLNGPNGKSLRNQTVHVTDIETQVLPYTEEALHILKREQGVGLAAPQIGVPYAWYVDLSGNFRINPLILESEEPQEMVEGCLSLPDKWYRKTRFKNVVLGYTDISGVECQEELKDLLAYIAQHETEHLSGQILSDTGQRVYAGEVEATSVQSDGTLTQQ